MQSVNVINKGTYSKIYFSGRDGKITKEVSINDIGEKFETVTTHVFEGSVISRKGGMLSKKRIVTMEDAIDFNTGAWI